MRRAPISPASVRYIKLGAHGLWERECIEKGIIRMGFGTADKQRLRLCESKRWGRIEESFIAEGRSQGTAKRFANELRSFFEDGGATLWITFMGERLYWGMIATGAPQSHPDGDGVWRTIKGGWRHTDVNGQPLTRDRLSGALTKLAAYRGTSCKVDVAEYVVRRINGQRMPEVVRALGVAQEMRKAIVGLMRMLTPQDFELLVDLVFADSGWRRVGVVGGTQKTLDLDLILPSTGERAFVQAKSKTTTAELGEYVAALGERADRFGRMFYVYHSGTPKPPADSRVTLIGPDRLAEMVLDAGLVQWLIEKVS